MWDDVIFFNERNNDSVALCFIALLQFVTFLIINAILAQFCLKMSPSILFFIWTFRFVLCCFLGRILLAPLPSTSLTMDVFTAQNIFFSLSAAVICCLQELLSRFPTARSKNCFLSPFFFFF